MKTNYDINELVKHDWINVSDEIVIPIRISRDELKFYSKQFNLTDEEWGFFQYSLLFSWRNEMFEKIREELETVINKHVFFIKTIQEEK